MVTTISWEEPGKYQTLLNLNVSDKGLSFDLRDVSYTIVRPHSSELVVIMISLREPVEYQTILNLNVSDENLLFDLRDVSYTLLFSLHSFEHGSKYFFYRISLTFCMRIINSASTCAVIKIIS